MIYICRYDESSDMELLLRYRRHLPLELPRGELNEVRRKALRQRILAWLLLEYGLGREYGLSVEDLAVLRSGKGKPFSSRYPEIRFNISHCDTACACILSHMDCGVDVERRFPYKESLARRVCQEEEWLLLQDSEASVRQEMLRLLWSMKESYVKMDGQGLGYGMEKINFSDVLGKLRWPMEKAYGTAYARQADIIEECGCWVFSEGMAQRFQLQRTALYTLAACGAEIPMQEIRLSEKELLEAMEQIW